MTPLRLFVRESHQLPPLGKQHWHAHIHTHPHIHTYTPAYLPHSSFVPFLSAIAAIRVAGAHAILIAHGHSPIAALSSVHINFPVISYTYTALVGLFRPCDVCLCGRSQSSGGKHRGGQTEQTSGGWLWHHWLGRTAQCNRKLAKPLSGMNRCYWVYLSGNYVLNVLWVNELCIY